MARTTTNTLRGVVLVLALAPCLWAQRPTFQQLNFTSGGATPVPSLIQAASTPSDIQSQSPMINTGAFMQACFANATQTGDTIVAGLITEIGSVGVISVTDDGASSNTYTRQISENAGSRIAAIYTAPVTNASHCVKVAFSSITGTLAGNQLTLYEYNNVGSIDVSCQNTATSGTSAACASMTTTQAGDLIFFLTNVVTFSSTPSGNMTWTAGSGYTPLDLGGLDWSATEYQIQSAAGAITPSMTVSQAVTRVNSVGIAMKASSGGGTVPSTVWLKSVQVRNGGNAGWSFSTTSSSTTQTFQFPCTGNDPWLMIAGIDSSGGGPNVSSVSDADSATWTGLTKVDSTGDAFQIQWWHITSGTTCTGGLKTLTVHYSASPATSIPLWVFFDVANSAGYDSSATCGAGSTPCAINTTCASSSSCPGATITPSSASSGAPELILSYNQQDFDTVSGANHAQFLTAIESCPGATGGCGGNGTGTSYAYAGPGFEQDAGILASYVTSNSAFAITWSVANTQSQNAGPWFSSTVAIK